MGKKKTLQKKKLSDMRRQQASSHQEVSSSSSQAYTFTFSSPHKSSPVVQTTVIADVRKTALICFTIIVLEIILFTLLQNHVLALPFVRY